MTHTLAAIACLFLVLGCRSECSKAQPELGWLVEPNSHAWAYDPNGDTWVRYVHPYGDE